MSKQVLWVIRDKDTDHIFPRLKDARASDFGWGLKTGLRIIHRIALDKIKSCSHNRSSAKKGVMCKTQLT
jgi:hypothetical protein